VKRQSSLYPPISELACAFTTWVPMDCSSARRCSHPPSSRTCTWATRMRTLFLLPFSFDMASPWLRRTARPACCTPSTWPFGLIAHAHPPSQHPTTSHLVLLVRPFTFSFDCSADPSNIRRQLSLPLLESFVCCYTSKAQFRQILLSSSKPVAPTHLHMPSPTLYSARVPSTASVHKLPMDSIHPLLHHSDTITPARTIWLPYCARPC
jgi:hypothetical protein